MEFSEEDEMPQGQGYKNGRGLSPSKARKILKHGKVKGKKLTDKQRRYMGAKSKPRRLNDVPAAALRRVKRNR